MRCLLPASHPAGLFDSILVPRTAEGARGTAGRWPSGRKITGVIMHSPAEFHVKHTALGALSNVTFVNYTYDAGSQFRGALEVCGKCKTFQGGATTFTRALKFIQQGKPMLSEWSWGHQGVFQVRRALSPAGPRTLPQPPQPRTAARSARLRLAPTHVPLPWCRRTRTAR